MRNLIALLLAAAIPVLSAQQPATARPPVATGPAVGAAVPAFEAPDQNGNIQTLKTIAGPKGAMLVFIRSADW
jgi:hypothetical protein